MLKPGKRRLQILQTRATMLEAPKSTKITPATLAIHLECLQARINLLLDRIEAAIRQSLRVAAAQQQLATNVDFGGLANLLLCYAIGRWQQYAKSGFTREPAANWAQQRTVLYIACQKRQPA